MRIPTLPRQSAAAHRRGGAPAGTRTQTEAILSRLPLPIGLRELLGNPNDDSDGRARGLLDRAVARQRPADKGIGVAMAHAVLGLEPVDDLHVLADGTRRDDLLPLGDR